MPLIDRIGIDIGIKHSVEDGLRWAAAHGLHYVDFRLDTGPEAFVAFTPERCAALRTQAEADGITIGLHTLSAVNIAEYAPYLAEAADHYLRTYIDIAKALQCGLGRCPCRLSFHQRCGAAQSGRPGALKARGRLCGSPGRALAARESELGARARGSPLSRP